MARPRNQVPTYRHHKQSGQAIVTVTHNGTRRDILLGKFGSAESKAEYERILAQIRTPAGVVALVQSAGKADLTVAEVLLPFLEHAEQHYRGPEGKPTSEFREYRVVVRAVRELYGDTPAKDFGPLSLKAVRRSFVKAGLARSEVNRRMNMARRIFRWAASEELIPAAVPLALDTVEGLGKGRTVARETEPIGPVDPAHVEAVLPFLSGPARGLIQFMRLTGSRPGEACLLRPCDIEKTEPVWVFTPSHHKNSHRGKFRSVVIGPRAQELLNGLPPVGPEEYIFDPRRAVAERNEARSAGRQTPRYPSHMARNEGKRVKAPKRAPRCRYSPGSISQAVGRAIERANRVGAKKAKGTEFAPIPEWHPNQLRHTFATEVRRVYGLEAAQVLLGHSKVNTTEIYAEKNLALGSKVAAEIG